MNRERECLLKFTNLWRYFFILTCIHLLHKKILHCGQTGTHFVVRYNIDIENLFSDSYFAVSTKDRLAD